MIYNSNKLASVIANMSKSVAVFTYKPAVPEVSLKEIGYVQGIFSIVVVLNFEFS